MTAYLEDFFTNLLGMIGDESIQEVWYDDDDPVAYWRYKIVEWVTRQILRTDKRGMRLLLASR